MMALLATMMLLCCLRMCHVRAFPNSNTRAGVHCNACTVNLSYTAFKVPHTGEYMLLYAAMQFPVYAATHLPVYAAIHLLVSVSYRPRLWHEEKSKMSEHGKRWV